MMSNYQLQKLGCKNASTLEQTFLLNFFFFYNQRAKLAIKLLELEGEEYSAIQQKNYELARKINEKAAAVKGKINN